MFAEMFINALLQQRVRDWSALSCLNFADDLSQQSGSNEPLITAPLLAEQDNKQPIVINWLEADDFSRAMTQQPSVAQ